MQTPSKEKGLSNSRKGATERGDVTMKTNFEGSCEAGSKDSSASFNLRRSKRCISSHCSWTSLMSKSKKPYQKSMAVGEKSDADGSVDGIVKDISMSSVGIPSASFKQKKTRRKRTNKEDHSTKNYKTKKTASMKTEKLKLRNKFQPNGRIRQPYSDLEEGCTLDDVWNILSAALAESSSESDSDEMIEQDQVNKTEPLISGSTEVDSDHDREMEMNQSKSDSRIVESLKRKKQRDELSTRIPVRESCQHHGKFSEISITSENETPDSDDMILNLHLSEVPETSDSLLAKLEVTNKYIVAVCGASEEASQEPVSTSDLLENCPSAASSDRVSSDILSSGLGKFILCAASDPQRRGKDQSVT